jgi:hypothetical protein
MNITGVARFKTIWIARHSGRKVLHPGDISLRLSELF